MGKGTYFIVGAALMAMSACTTTEMTSRNATVDFSVGSKSQYTRQDYTVRDVKVTIAPGTTVSEANRYYPSSDIVWREDPRGDRYAQVSAIFDAAMTSGVAALKGAVPVLVEIEIHRFHALTEKTRYSSLPATHAIQFAVTVRHATTGAVIEGPRMVKTSLKAYTGEQAFASEARGESQKSRISAHLAQTIQHELSVSAPVATVAAR